MLLLNYQLNAEGDQHRVKVKNDDGEVRELLVKTKGSVPSYHALSVAAFAAMSARIQFEQDEERFQARLKEEEAKDTPDAEPITEVREAEDIVKASGAEPPPTDPSRPTMLNRKPEIVAFAEANKVEMNSGDTKQDILDKISDALDTGASE